MNPLDDDNLSLKTRGGSYNSVKFCDAFCTWKLWRVGVYAMFVGFSSQIPNIIAPAIGEDWFNDEGHYSYWNGVFTSISGVLGFLTQSYFGKISDIYGRKRVLIFIWLTMFLSMWWLTITRNIWIYLVLMPIGQLNGSFGGIPTILQASIADTLPEEHRTLAFGVLYGIAGIIVIGASVLTVVVQDIYGITAVMIAFDVSMGISLIWLIFVYEETLHLDRRNKNKIFYENKERIERERDIKNGLNCFVRCLKHSLKPLRPLAEMKRNSLLLWFGIIALFVGLPESGVDDLLALYCFKLLGLKGDNKETTFTSLATICIGLSMLVSQLILLPLLVKCSQKNDVLLIGCALLAVAGFSVWGIMLYFLPYYTFGLGLWAAFGTSFIAIPILSGALSKRLDPKQQGVGLGVIHAMKGITWAVAPYLFSFLFDFFENDGFWVTMPYIAATIFILCGFPVLCCPLRNAIRHYDDEKMKDGLAPVPQIDYDENDSQGSSLTQTMLVVGNEGNGGKEGI